MLPIVGVVGAFKVSSYPVQQRRTILTILVEGLPRNIPTKWGRVAQSVGHLTRKSGSWVRYPVWQHTFVSPSAFSRRAVVSYWRKYVHEVLVNRLGGLSLPRKSVVRLTDHPDMTLDVYWDVKQQYNSNLQDDFKICQPI